MRAALAVLRLQPATRRIAVLGDMLELGDAGPAEHRALAADGRGRRPTCLFACGPLMRDLFAAVPAARCAARTRRIPRRWRRSSRGALAPGDAVLIKGSLGSRMKLVVDALDSARAEAA